MSSAVSPNGRPASTTASASCVYPRRAVLSSTGRRRFAPPAFEATTQEAHLFQLGSLCAILTSPPLKPLLPPPPMACVRHCSKAPARSQQSLGPHKSRVTACAARPTMNFTPSRRPRCHHRHRPSTTRPS
eukprot:190728-Pleurochrysis_carterae.AAC.1